jgi:hypothetical protein
VRREVINGSPTAGNLTRVRMDLQVNSILVKFSSHFFALLRAKILPPDLTDLAGESENDIVP